jgi:hypothetical protein
LDDSALFPFGTPKTYPKQFDKAVKDIIKWMYRIYAHLILHHGGDIVNYDEKHGVEIGNEMNLSFRHLLYFAFEFDLLDSKEIKGCSSEMKAWILKNMGQKYKSLWK